ncbi:MAG TPA: right-handed parallel beta-helix repeat-containing protein [Gaiellaceae bacterium]|nr:right-handed parallel beta-helix repeat-containing protein [Gaiellaceae bacterium]
MTRRLTAAVVSAVALLALLVSGAAAATTTVVVTATTPGWIGLQETATASGAFVSGPGTAPLGAGSYRFDTSGVPGGGFLLAGDVQQGVRLSEIDAIDLATFTRSGVGLNANVVPSVQIGWDPDLDDVDLSWKGRLVGFYNPAPTPDVWTAWDTLNDFDWYFTQASGDPDLIGCVGIANACSWSDIAAAYPDGGVSLGEFSPGVPIGFLGVKAGSGTGTTETYADAFTIVVDGDDTVYNFEPGGACSTSTSGTTITLLADCTVTSSFVIPDGFTLDGDGNALIAQDPGAGPGQQFRGAVVKNGGSTAHVTDLEVTANGLADVCDGGADRLRGILFDGARGSITNVNVHGVRQGLSGCQEGNAIEARNVDALVGNQLVVTISGSLASDYQKNGITANGNVAATITGNTVTGDGAVNYIAQNGIQVGFGATALVKGNGVTGNNYAPADTVACGLLFFQATGVKQQSNTFAANEKNLCNAGRGGGNVNAAP